MYTSIITITHDAKQFEQLFYAEQKELGRASYTIARNKNNITITVSAQDATALKIAFNTIVKVLSVWEKTKMISEHNG